MWYWLVTYKMPDGKKGYVRSRQGWDEKWKAQFNIEARMNHPSSVDIHNLPEDALVYYVEVVYEEE